MLRRVQFCPQNMQCPSAVWESENLTKTNVIQKLWSKPGSTRSVLTSKTCWSCFFTIPPFVQTLSPVLQLADSEPAFRCKIVNHYCLCCRTEKTGTTAAKNPSVLDQACGSTGTLLLGITWPWMLVNIAKITTKCYLSVWTLTEDVLILSASLTNSVSAAGTAWEHTGSYLVWSLCLLEAR